ncbi:hypothetical protein [Siphonobacter sp.]|uniref:hypothetical protein n=1 Tax=Siphonobacter sp. TaxID=1869184 RepID=UPI003B3BBEF4
MEKIKPYASIEEAMQELDNGGRFYNLFTKVQDEVITPAELSKVSGVFLTKQRMILFLEMALSRLDEKAKEEVLSKLDDRLQLHYQNYKPLQITVSEAIKEHCSSSIIVTGTPKPNTSKSALKGFVMIPVGKSFTLVPIVDLYDIYELTDEHTAEKLLIAHSKRSTKLPEQKLMMGGIWKKFPTTSDQRTAADQALTTDALEPSTSNQRGKRYLEIHYFLE